MNFEEFQQKHVSLLHAIQTGIAYVMEKDGTATSPKHLRVGVSVALCDIAGLVRALFAAGVLTEEQYYDGVIAVLEEEKARYQQEVSDLYGAHVELG